MTKRQKSKINWPVRADLTAFSWRVPEPGFEWIIADSVNGEHTSYLVVRAEPPRVVTYLPFSPLDETGLFRTFGDLPLTREGVLDFAGKYGFLGSDPTRNNPPTVIVPRPGVDVGTFWSVPGERLDDWAVEHHAMRETISLWDAITEKQDGNYAYYEGKEKKQGTPETYLSSVIHWSGSAAVSYTRPVPEKDRFSEFWRIWRKNKADLPDKLKSFDSRFQIASEADSELFKRFTPGDLRLPGQYALQKIINDKLWEYASRAKLLWDWRRRNPDLRMQLVPTSLIAALWLQLAAAIDGDRAYRRCEACKKWFEVSAENRIDAKFCQQSCRFRAYRQRQQQARELADQGMPPREIAALVDSDAETVKGWLKKK
jgi:hypothetical protein